MKDGVPDTRQKAILQAAWQAFAAYGFRKTSMDDIARAADMSRPAVYLHYKNKEDIFRSLVQAYYDDAAGRVVLALETDGTIAQVLAAAFDAQIGETMEAMLASPHGMELLDTGATAAADIKAAGEERLCAIYADWLGRLSGAGRVSLPDSAERVAATITVALKGLKTSGIDMATLRTRMAILAELTGRGLDTA